MTEFFTPERDKLGLRLPVETREGLPMVLLIGDSISCGYTEGVMRNLRDVCNVRRAPDNCGDTRRGLEKLDEWAGDTDWDLIHFNWGLHDLCYRHPESTVQGNRDKVRGSIAVTLDQYRENLDFLTRRLKKLAPKLIWASTTFIPPEEAGRVQGDDLKYNQVALEIMARHEVPVDDLHALTATFSSELFVGPGDVHFTEEGSRQLSSAVADSIRKNF